jgi:hypothetical protein
MPDTKVLIECVCDVMRGEAKEVAEDVRSKRWSLESVDSRAVGSLLDQYRSYQLVVALFITLPPHDGVRI